MSETSNGLKIVFATDHAGFELKNTLLAYVRDELGYEVIDCGAEVYDESDDYPEFISNAAKIVSENPLDHRGIILGGSGQGEAMVANRFAHVRATVFYGEPLGSELSIIHLSREHNDANILSIGARFVTAEAAKDAVKQWLTIEFSGDERHKRRVTNIDTLTA
jgi:ribose 5-phosphate isomerase B